MLFCELVKAKTTKASREGVRCFFTRERLSAHETSHSEVFSTRGWKKAECILVFVYFFQTNALTRGEKQEKFLHRKSDFLWLCKKVVKRLFAFVCIIRLREKKRGREHENARTFGIKKIENSLREKRSEKKEYQKKSDFCEKFLRQINFTTLREIMRENDRNTKENLGMKNGKLKEN